MQTETSRPTPSGRPAVRPVVELKGVRVSYTIEDETAPVLKGLNLELARGEFASLMGQSGSGKSTILNVISGLLPPDEGAVLLDGEDLYAHGDHARTLLRREKIGFIFQFFNLIPSLSVEDNVALPLLIAEQDPRKEADRLAELLDLVGLGHRRRHLPGQLSGGEMQRVTIARALVRRPELLLADEPTGNVSARMGGEIMDLLQRAHTELGQTILLVTHNHKDAARGQRVVFLKDGEIPPRGELCAGEIDEARILSVLQELDI